MCYLLVSFFVLVSFCISSIKLSSDHGFNVKKNYEGGVKVLALMNKRRFTSSETF
jgi:hypothetical protein